MQNLTIEQKYERVTAIADELEQLFDCVVICINTRHINEEMKLTEICTSWYRGGVAQSLGTVINAKRRFEHILDSTHEDEEEE